MYVGFIFETNGFLLIHKGKCEKYSKQLSYMISRLESLAKHANKNNSR